MPAAVDLALLDAKLDQLTGTPVITKLRALIQEADDRELFRINPYVFAEREGVSPGQAVELFLRAAALGLVRTEWSLFCRGCGEYAISHAALGRSGRQLPLSCAEPGRPIRSVESRRPKARETDARARWDRPTVTIDTAAGGSPRSPTWIPMSYAR